MSDKMQWILLLVVSLPLIFGESSILSYTDILSDHCSPPFYYYKSWCYYLVPHLSVDWFSANRYCRSIDSQATLFYIKDTDEMITPLRDILISRENFPLNQSLWTNTSWGEQRRTILSRQSKRFCRKLQLKSRSKFGQIDQFRMPFSNCREKHRVLCRKELPKNIFCPHPWAFAYGICYYLDEQARRVTSEEEERNTVQCQAWQGDLFFSSKEEKSILPPFLSYSLHGIESSEILPENFGGVSYQFSNLIDQPCSLLSGDVYLSATMKTLRKKQNGTRLCSSYQSHTFCRQRFNSSCSPPWFADDGFCLYFSSEKPRDRAAAAAECAQHGGSLLYISNEEELFRLTRNLLILSPFFPSLSLAGVWLAMSYRAPYAQSPAEFDWLWEYAIESNLDPNWRTTEWKRFFQWRLSPDIVSAGDCAALILDRQIREPIERTSCDYPRTVICRKPFDHQRLRSFHQKDRYRKVGRLQNFTEMPKRTTHENTSMVTVQRNLLEQYNSTTYRWVVHLNGSSAGAKQHLVLICQSRGILQEEFVLPTSVLTFDLPIKSNRNEYELMFHYLRSSECVQHRTNASCLYVSCQSNDPWAYLLPEISRRWNSTRFSTTKNERCSAKTNYSTSDRILCEILIDQFQFSDDARLSLSSSSSNRCDDYGGQCISDALIQSQTFPFMDPYLNCSTGFVCVFLGERCHTDSYCMDRLRFPCSISSQLPNVTCSNPHYDCCQSRSSPNHSAVIVSDSTAPAAWNIFLPLYYFSFHAISKWDRLFFDSWLKMDSDLSQDFVNDEFVYSCHGIFLQPTLLITHQSCRPTSSILSNDKRSILFSLVKKPHFDLLDPDQYDRVALQIDSYQVYSPFQLVRLAYQLDFLVNKTFTPLNRAELSDHDVASLHCILVQYENPSRPVRLLNNFQRQFFFDDDTAVFLFDTNDLDDDTEHPSWSFAPIICSLPKHEYDWTIVGISGQQLKHRCLIHNHKKYCQMTMIYASTWNWG